MNNRAVLVGAIVAIIGLTTAAILFATGSEAMQRLALLVGIVSPTLLALLALLRSDAAAKSTDATSGIAEALNGNFDARVRNAIRHVNAEPESRPEPVMIATHDAISRETTAPDAPTPAPIADPARKAKK